MNIPEIVTYKKANRALQLIALASIVGSVLLVFIIYVYSSSQKSNLSNKYVYELTNNQWVIDQSTGLAMNLERSAISEDTKRIEYRHHVKMVYKSFYEFDPFENIDEKLNNGLYLVDKNVGQDLLDAHDATNLTNKIKISSMFLYVTVDSIPDNLMRTENGIITGVAYARQTIKRRRGKGTRYLDIEFQIKPEGNRSDKNPHGLTITKWKILNNKKVTIENRTQDNEQ